MDAQDRQDEIHVYFRSTIVHEFETDFLPPPQYHQFIPIQFILYIHVNSPTAIPKEIENSKKASRSFNATGFNSELTIVSIMLLLFE